MCQLGCSVELPARDRKHRVVLQKVRRAQGVLECALLFKRFLDELLCIVDSVAHAVTERASGQRITACPLFTVLVSQRQNAHARLQAARRIPAVGLRVDQGEHGYELRRVVAGLSVRVQRLLKATNCFVEIPAEEMIGP
ncbi:hypothetical protein [Rhodococcus sp. 3A]|uniref:hypothetical protein n=1 Tax=Rhodococcus sp. 3A TaxID=2834581 RepID=UPI0020784E61|nr:hypothetical protein [Rhodococcus sp. 3A]